jgi:hypothetical protein
MTTELKSSASRADMYVTERARDEKFGPAARCPEMGSGARNRTLAVIRVLPVRAYSFMANTSRFNCDCPLRSARIH